jgi:hypothetical protein
VLAATAVRKAAGTAGARSGGPERPGRLAAR